MDVNLLLHELRELAGEIAALTDGLGDRDDMDADLSTHVAEAGEKLAGKFDVLDQWMSKGKGAPDAWREAEDHR